MRDTIAVEIAPGGKALAMAAPKSLGVFQLSVDSTDAGNSLAALITAAGGDLSALIAAGLSMVRASVSLFPVRMRNDGGDPATIGLTYGKDNTVPYTWDPGDFTLMHLIGIGGTATVMLECYA